MNINLSDYSHWLIIIIMFLLWLIPISMIVNANNVEKDEKILWLLACIFISWLAWFFFMLFAPLKSGGKK